MNSIATGSMNLAAAIANAKLKRTTSIKEDGSNSGGDNSSTSSSSSSSVVAARNAAPGNLMDEMAKTLARRRAQAESNSQPQNPQDGSNNDRFNNKDGNKTSMVNGCSPSKDDSKDYHNRYDDDINNHVRLSIIFDCVIFLIDEPAYPTMMIKQKLMASVITIWIVYAWKL